MIERTDGVIVIYERSIGSRFVFATFFMIFAWLTFACLARVISLWVTMDLSPSNAAAGTLLFGAGAVGVLYRTGPKRLTLDSAQRSYTFVQGFPVFPRTWSGPWSDFTRTCVGSAQYRSTTSYMVVLLRRGAGPAKVEVDARDDRSAAEAKARDLAELLGIPFREKCDENTPV